MKKLFILLLFAVSLMATPNHKIYGQGANDSLSVFEMSGFPDLPLDSAFEGQSYSFSVSVSNLTNFNINSALEVLMRVDSIETIILSNPATSLPAGDSLTLSVSQYFFTQPQFKAGNNIVVVWPRVPGMNLPVDTFYTFVYFVPLSSTGVPSETGQAGIRAFPNPTDDMISLFAGETMDLEYVRIFDTSGRLVYRSDVQVEQTIDIGFLRSGSYFLEAVSREQVYRTKFIRK